MSVVIFNPNIEDREGTLAKRNLGYLSDGTLVALLTGKSSPPEASDGTLNDASIWYSDDGGASWTYSQSYSFGSPYRSMAVDASDNIHVIFFAEGDIRTLKFSKGVGLTWTPESESTVAAVDSGHFLHNFDIDVTDDEVILAIWGIRKGGTTPSSKVYISAKGTLGSWSAKHEVHSGNLAQIECASISRNYGGSSGGTEKIAFAATNSLTQIDLKVADVTVTSGAISGVTSIAILASDSKLPQGTNQGLLFARGDDDWLFVGQLKSGIEVGVEKTKADERPAVAVRFNATKVTLYRSGNGLVTTKPSDPLVSYNMTSIGNAVIVGRGKTYSSPGKLVSDGTGDLDIISTQMITNGAAFLARRVPAEAVGQRFRWTGGGANRNLQPAFTWLAIDNDDSAGQSVSFTTSIGTSTAKVTNPADGATILTSEPPLAASGAVTSGVHTGQIGGVFQIADDSAFTVNYKEVDGSGSSLFSAVVPFAKALTQDVNYIKVTLKDVITGQTGGTSGVNSFTVSHPPSAISIFPANSQTVEWKPTTNISWTFADTWANDQQSAYQVVVEKNEDGTLIYDTGKVSSTSGTASIPILVANVDIVLRAKVKLWDQSDISGDYSDYSLFVLSEAPVATLTAPADEEVLTGPNPVFGWTYSSPSSSPQQAYKVDISLDGDLVYTSGWVASDGDEHALTGQILQNLSTYDVTLYVKDSRGLVGSDSLSFSTSWIKPDYVVPSVAAEAESVLISWSNMDQDDEFYSWRIYRRTTGTEEWTLVTEVFTTSSTYGVSDWALPVNTEQEYAVVQVATRFGALVESDYIPRDVILLSDSYWLIHPEDQSQSVKLEHVTSDSFSEEYEEETYTLIGRGRHTDYGTRLGFAGSLVAELRDIEGSSTARLQRLLIEQLKAQEISLYLRNPFGDLWKVSVGDIAIERVAGVGLQEMSKITVPYREVS